MTSRAETSTGDLRLVTIMEHQQLKRKISESAKSLGVANRMVVPVGNARSNVWIFGHAPDLDEKSPFASEGNTLIRNTLLSMGVNASRALLGYLIPVHYETHQTDPTLCKMWLRYFDLEVQLMRPRAVVLLGLKAARLALGVVGQSLEALRGTRFYFEGDLDANYFVTYGASEMAEGGGYYTRTGVQWVTDLSNIFEVVEASFPRQQMAKRVRCAS